MGTRSLTTFLDEKGELVCRMYINGDGFPWVFGVTLAEHVLHYNDPEWERSLALVVGEFVQDAPDRTLLIGNDIGWGEDYRYIIQRPWSKNVGPQITVEYPTLDHKKVVISTSCEDFVLRIRKFDENESWKDYEDNQEALEHIFRDLIKVV